MARSCCKKPQIKIGILYDPFNNKTRQNCLTVLTQKCFGKKSVLDRKICQVDRLVASNFGDPEFVGLNLALSF